MNQPKSKLNCISRQHAIEALMAYFIPQTYTGEQVEQAEKLAQKIMNKVPPVVPDFKTFCGVPIKEAIEVLEKYKHSPSVTPTERTGEWVEIPQSDFWKCSCCGDIDFPRDYCPNCGAKMKGQII